MPSGRDQKRQATDINLTKVSEIRYEHHAAGDICILVLVYFP